MYLGIFKHDLSHCKCNKIQVKMGKIHFWQIECQISQQFCTKINMRGIPILLRVFLIIIIDEKIHFLFGHFWPSWPLRPLCILKLIFSSRIRLSVAKSRFVQNFSPLLNFGEVPDQKWSQNVNILLEGKNRHLAPNSSQK